MSNEINFHNKSDNELIKSKQNILKIVILGDSRVGKTSLIDQLVYSHFSSDYTETVGANFTKKEIFLGNSNNKPLVLFFIDVSGGEQYVDLRKTFYSANEFLLAVYDLINNKSLDNLENIWIPEYMHILPLNKRIKIFLIGTKLDLKNFLKVSFEDLEATAKRLEAKYSNILFIRPHLMTSAKENINLNLNKDEASILKNIVLQIQNHQ